MAAKVVESDPWGMVTEAGTVTAAVLLLESGTTNPPADAAPDNVRVQIDDVLPLLIVVGVHDSPVKVTAAGRMLTDPPLPLIGRASPAAEPANVPVT